MDLAKYMEEGIKWCDVVLLFHSENAMKSEAVQNECNLAEKHGKKILLISNNIPLLPEKFRRRWVINFNNFKQDELIKEIRLGIANLFGN